MPGVEEEVGEYIARRVAEAPQCPFSAALGRYWRARSHQRRLPAAAGEAELDAAIDRTEAAFALMMAAPSPDLTALACKIGAAIIDNPTPNDGGLIPETAAIAIWEEAARLGASR